MSLQHTLPAGAATDPPWRQSIALAASLWEIACRHGLGQSTRSEYRGQLAEVLAHYPALTGRTATAAAARPPAAVATAAAERTAAGTTAVPATPRAYAAPTASGGRRYCGAPQ